MLKEKRKKMRVNEIIRQFYPLYTPAEDMELTTDDQLAILLLEIEEGYEETINDYLKKYEKKIKDYTELKSPYREQSKIKSQNNYVYNSLKNSLLLYKPMTENLIDMAIWAYRQKTTDTSNFYD
jgi:hypothetical protein